jgi:hypothetical protein
MFITHMSKTSASYSSATVICYNIIQKFSKGRTCIRGKQHYILRFLNPHVQLHTWKILMVQVYVVETSDILNT